MRPDDRRDGRQHRDGQGGIPDGLLIGILAFLLGITLLVWTATGLAGWFANGAWPSGVTFTRTPLAMRSLIAEPHDIPGAWPDTPAGQLSGYGLFWGLFIGQLMILVVLTVFVLGTVARWRAVRAGRRAGKAAPGNDPALPPAPVRAEVPAPRREPDPESEPTAARHIENPRWRPAPTPRHRRRSSTSPSARKHRPQHPSPPPCSPHHGSADARRSS